MAQGRVTQAGVYVETGGAAAEVTQALVYVETGPKERARITQAGVYVELGITSEARVTQAAHYQEWVQRIYRQCTRVWYNDVEITGYTFGLDIIAQASRLSVQTLCDNQFKWAMLPAAWELTLAGEWSSVVDGQLGADLIAGEAYRRILVKYELPPHYTIWYEWKRAQMLRYEIDAAPGQGVEWAAGIIFDSEPRRTLD